LAAFAEGDGNLDSFRGGIVLMQTENSIETGILPARNKRK
jgi:hypothetical protein